MLAANSEDRHASPPLLRRRLGSELRRLREEAGLTRGEVAGHLYCSASKISRLETGRVSVSPRDVKDMLNLYELTEEQTKALHQLAGEARHGDDWWHSCRDVPDVRTYMSFERASSSIWVFESSAIPGLLQSEGYARLIIRTLLPHLNDQEVARHVELRMERQRLLCDDCAPELQAVLDEATVQRLIGMPEVMKDQIEHLQSVARKSNVTIQVLPFTAGAHEGMDGAFTILGFPHEADREVVFVELPAGELYLDSEDHLRRYRRIFERLQAAALPTEDSIALLTAIARNWEKISEQSCLQDGATEDRTLRT